MTTLRTDNIARFKSELSIDELTCTFKDAFEMTEYLGHKHIWIDYLCKRSDFTSWDMCQSCRQSFGILQDSASDWAQEVQKMADVYENATCNLAATAHASSGAGLFALESTDRAKLTKVAANIALEKDILVGVYHLVPKKIWDCRVDQAPLNERAWVLQERFLSPRILHFGNDQLWWECQELQAYEIYVHGQAFTEAYFTRSPSSTYSWLPT